MWDLRGVKGGKENHKACKYTGPKSRVPWNKAVRERAFLGRRLHEQEGSVQCAFSGELHGKESSPFRWGLPRSEEVCLGVGDHVAILTSASGPTTKDSKEMPAGPCCACICATGLQTRVPWGIRLGLRRSPRLHSACCPNLGNSDQVEDHEHCCLLQPRHPAS